MAAALCGKRFRFSETLRVQSPIHSARKVTSRIRRLFRPPDSEPNPFRAALEWSAVYGHVSPCPFRLPREPGGAFTSELALEHADAIREMHREFLHAGTEVLQVMAFYGSREKLATVGKGDRAFEINQAATRTAKEVAGDNVLVAGDLSATWKWQADSPSERSLVAGMLDEQIEAQSGVDFFIGETFWHFGEARLCLERVKAKTRLPAMITVAFRAKPVTDDGVSAGECARILSGEGAEIVGVNCMRDSQRTYPIIEEMRRCTKGFLAAQPVAFRCSDQTPWFTGTSAFPERLEPTQLTRYEMADFAVKARDMGVNYIGSCCGSVACHVREMARVLGQYREEQVWKPQPEAPMSETEFNWKRRQKVTAT